MTNHVVPISTEIERFREHLSSDDNIRILFSAPFGAGKSSFLTTFFDTNDGYLVIKLFPTSYSVASNKDIFELIKYDILTSIFEGFSEHIELGKEEFDNFLIGQMYALHQMDLYSVSQAIAKIFIPKAKAPLEVVDQVKGLFEKFTDYKKELSKTDEDSIIDYLVSLRMQTGSIKEQDFYTQKIKDYLNTIRKKSKKQIVLVVDDLDRLDADHVFRIFNIFTAHYDSKTEVNKFGFDKIILVCDINTIEHLFYHRYGSKAEFKGYIDKFYSHIPFNFSNKKHLKENITALLRPKNRLSKTDSQKGRVLESVYGIDNSAFYDAFKYVLSNLIELDYVKIRNFHKFQEYSLPSAIIRNSIHEEIDSDSYRFLVLMHLLSQFFPRFQDLELAIIALYQNYPADYKTGPNSVYDTWKLDSILIDFSVWLLGAVDNLPFDQKQHKVEFISENNDSIVVVFSRSHSWLDKGIEYQRCLSNVDSTDEHGNIKGPVINRPNPFWFLYKAYLECKRRRYKIGLNEF